MGDVDFKDFSSVLVHVVANHQTWNGKWLGFCTLCSLSHFSSPFPSAYPFGFLIYLCVHSWVFLAYIPTVKQVQLNFSVNTDILLSGWAEPWACCYGSGTMPGLDSLCHLSWLMAEKWAWPPYHRAWVHLHFTVWIQRCCSGMNVEWMWTWASCRFWYYPKSI